MDENSLLRLSALEQGALVRAKRIKSRDITELYLARIKRHDAGLNAFVNVFHKDARKMADAIDKRVARGDELPLFAGVPLAIKDIAMVGGHTLSVGSRACMLRYSPVDDLMVRKLRAGGFVFLGKTRMSEFGALPLTLSKRFPPARNPWNISKNTGGSSGGSAGAVASGMAPIAHGADGAGSIRIPAALSGLFGHKPSRGLIPNGVMIDSPRLVVVDGPMTRSVCDAAAMTDVMSGATRTGAPSMLAACDQPVGPLRVRVAIKNTFIEPEPAIVNAVHAMAKALEQRGDVLSDGEMPDVNVDQFLPLWERAIALFPITIWQLAEPVSQWLHARYTKGMADGFDYDAAHDSLVRRLEAWFGDADVWVTPTVGMGAPDAQWVDCSSPGEDQFRKVAPLGVYTAVVNILGYPAVTIPMGFTPQGLPIGVQIIARHGQDAMLYALARWAEKKFAWSEAWPPGYGPR